MMIRVDGDVESLIESTRYFLITCRRKATTEHSFFESKHFNAIFV